MVRGLERGQVDRGREGERGREGTIYHTKDELMSTLSSPALHTSTRHSGTLAALSETMVSAARRDTGTGGVVGGGVVTVGYQAAVGGSIRSHFLSVNCILCDTLSRFFCTPYSPHRLLNPKPPSSSSSSSS